MADNHNLVTSADEHICLVIASELVGSVLRYVGNEEKMVQTAVGTLKHTDCDHWGIGLFIGKVGVRLPICIDTQPQAVAVSQRISFHYSEIMKDLGCSSINKTYISSN